MTNKKIALLHTEILVKQKENSSKRLARKKLFLNQSISRLCRFESEQIATSYFHLLILCCFFVHGNLLSRFHKHHEAPEFSVSEQRNVSIKKIASYFCRNENQSLRVNRQRQKPINELTSSEIRFHRNESIEDIVCFEKLLDVWKFQINCQYLEYSFESKISVAIVSVKEKKYNRKQKEPFYLINCLAWSSKYS